MISIQRKTHFRLFFSKIYQNQKLILGQKARVDILINKSIIVEIDENRHIGYDKIDEINRTNFLIGKGYKIIRIDNKVNIGKFIGIVYKCIMDNNFELYKTY